MKIAFYLASGDWMYHAFVRGAEAGGATTFVFNYRFAWSRVHFTPVAEKQVLEDEDHFVQQMERLVPEQGLDAIFMCVSDDNISESALKKLRRLQVPLINYHPDMGFLWFRILRIAKYFDLVACAQSMHLSALQRCGVQAHFIPFAATPSLAAPKPVSFEGLRYLGSPFGDRAHTIGYLHRNSLPVEVWGHNWDWFPRQTSLEVGMQVKQAGFRLPLPDIKLITDFKYYFLPRLREQPGFLLSKSWDHLKHRLFPQPLDIEGFYGHLPGNVIKGRYSSDAFEGLVQSARVNLGFSHMFPARAPYKSNFQMRLRDIEIPMAGGFYLAEHSDDLLHCFIPGQHIETWKNKDELMEKTRFYLKNPSKAASISLAGQQHASSNHTWAHRFNQMFSIIGLSIKLKVPSHPGQR